MRILCLDLGMKTCGFAISDDLNIIASPLLNMVYPNEDLSFVVNQVEQYFQQYNNQINTIILGYPTNVYDASMTNNTSRVINLYHLLRNKYDSSIIIELVDERFTTRIADQAMRDVNMKAKKRKMNKDRIAACFILQYYLKIIKG
ncbi:Holliday junction resolvase RuvX [Ureaplasma canigenitalium]|uniref:Holliday junction resolvase RuvX n=1 Tax=Ureaplasma canigenitalium TaxID=42092 RepID=UPI0004E1D4C1|nr:Holliday junction resolvase RuvX [Ureaplasma canigenitalium]